MAKHMSDSKFNHNPGATHFFLNISRNLLNLPYLP
jgi:hypothetical protein